MSYKNAFSFICVICDCDDNIFINQGIIKTLVQQYSKHIYSIYTAMSHWSCQLPFLLAANFIAESGYYVCGTLKAGSSYFHLMFGHPHSENCTMAVNRSTLLSVVN